MEWLNYHHLYYFWKVVRAGSIARGASELYLAPSTVSAQLHELEKALGETLLSRARRAAVPTEMGRMVYRYADEIFGVGQELLDAVRQRPTGRPLRLIVGVDDVVPKEVAHQLIEPALRLPEPVRLLCREASLERLVADLAVHEIDLVLSDSGITPTLSVRAYSHLLGECGVVFMGTPALATAHRPRFPRSLDGAPMLLPTDDTAIRRSLDQWLASRSLRPVVVGEFEDLSLMRVFGQAGTGVFPVPAVVETQFARQYGLQRVGRAQEVRSRFYALSLERQVKHPAVAAICSVARRRLGQTAGTRRAHRNGKRSARRSNSSSHP